VNSLISGGEVIASAPGSTATLAAGTLLNSHILHCDRTSGSGSVTAAATFDTPIIALSFNDGTLDGSDFLGNSATSYPTGTYGRRMIFGEGTDSLSVSADRMQLTAVTQRAGAPYLDELRVFTDATTFIIPEPATLLLWSLLAGLGAGLAWRRRR